MTLEQALEFDSFVSIDDAIHECGNHGIVAVVVAWKLIDLHTREIIAPITSGMIRSRDVLEWLGY